MKSSRILVLLACVAVLGTTSGCRWFSRPSPPQELTATEAAPAEVAAAQTAPAEIAPAETTASEEATPASKAAAKQAATLADDFYTMHMRISARGIPAPAIANAYNAFLCPSLADALAEAYRRQRAFITEHPGDKPPLIEGDLFSSLFEGPEKVSVAESRLSGDSARVALAMSNGTGARRTRWTDIAVLARDGGSWCVADVEYRGFWSFANKGKLSETLRTAF